MSSLRDDFEDIMELFIGINYDLEKMRDAGYIEITDNLVILRDMLGKFQDKLAGQKTLPRVKPKTKPKPLPKPPPKTLPASKKIAAPKKVAARRPKVEAKSDSESDSDSDSESGSS